MILYPDQPTHHEVRIVSRDCRPASCFSYLTEPLGLTRALWFAGAWEDTTQCQGRPGEQNSTPSFYIVGKLRTFYIIKRDLGLVCGHHMGGWALKGGTRESQRERSWRRKQVWRSHWLRCQGEFSSSPLPLGGSPFHRLTSAPKATVSSQLVRQFKLNKQTNSQNSAFIYRWQRFLFLPDQIKIDCFSVIVNCLLIDNSFEAQVNAPFPFLCPCHAGDGTW